MRGGAGAGSCSPGPTTTRDIVTHRREADSRPSAAAAAAILSRYRLRGSGQNIFIPRHVKMLLRGPVGLLLPTPPRHCNSSSNNNNNSSGGGAAAAGPNISQGSRYSADHCRADGRLVSSLAVQSRIMYNIWDWGVQATSTFPPLPLVSITGITPPPPPPLPPRYNYNY